jgi:hypothetical protein
MSTRGGTVPNHSERELRERRHKLGIEIESSWNSSLCRRTRSRLAPTRQRAHPYKHGFERAGKTEPMWIYWGREYRLRVE